MDQQKFDREAIKQRILGLQKKKYLVDIKNIKSEIFELEKKFKKILSKYNCETMYDLKSAVSPAIYEEAEHIKKETEKKKIDLAYIQEQGRKVKRELRTTSSKMFPEHNENSENAGS